MGRRRIAPCISLPRPQMASGHLQAPSPLSSLKLHRRLCEPQEHTRRCGLKKNLLPEIELRFLCNSVRSLVTTQAEVEVVYGRNFNSKLYTSNLVSVWKLYNFHDRVLPLGYYVGKVTVCTADWKDVQRRQTTYPRNELPIFLKVDRNSTAFTPIPRSSNSNFNKNKYKITVVRTSEVEVTPTVVKVWSWRRVPYWSTQDIQLQMT
jgi:hypothetical protein